MCIRDRAVVKRVREYRERGDEVVFTLDTHGEDYLDTMEGRKLPVPHCIKGTKGWELCDALAGEPGRQFETVSYTHLDVYKRQAPCW